MNELTNKLRNCSLFNNLEQNEINSILNSINFAIKPYNKNQIIAFEEDHLSNIGIVLEGEIEMQKIHPSAKTIIITKMHPFDIFGEVIVFSNRNIYPVTILSLTTSKIMYISKSDILKLCKYSTPILENLMALVSNKMLILSDKLTLLSYKTIREKVSSFLVTENLKQNSLILKLYCSKKNISEQLDVTRPSFSRELALMKEEGLITYDNKTITIINLKLIKDSLT